MPRRYGEFAANSHVAPNEFSVNMIMVPDEVVQQLIVDLENHLKELEQRAEEERSTEASAAR